MVEYPQILHFEPINLCQASCFMCPYSWLKDDPSFYKKTMAPYKIELLLADFYSIKCKYNVPDWSMWVLPYRISDPLVNPNLELILELCDKYKFKVELTTNGVGFTKSNSEILEKYLHLFDKHDITISIVGHSEEEVAEFMNIKRGKVLNNLKNLKENFPKLSSYTNVVLKHKLQNFPAPQEVIEEYQNVTLGRVNPINKTWIYSRASSGRGKWMDSVNPIVDQNNYVVGCGVKMEFCSDPLPRHRIDVEIELDVDGNMNHCIEDVEGFVNYGNVFNIGIESAWKNLRKSRDYIFSDSYSEHKHKLLCNQCSRAIWKGN